MLRKISFYSAIALAYIVFLFIPQIHLIQNVHCSNRTKGRSSKKTTTQETPFNLTACLRNFKIVPYYVPIEPKHLCRIMYEDFEVGYGNKVLQELIVLNKPNITWPYKNNTYYTLMMTDLDYHPEMMMAMKESFSWLVCDIPRNDIEKGRTVYTYFGEDSILFKGIHRYIVYIFKQKVYPLDICLPAIHDNWRWVWRTFEFAKRFNLSLVPVAGNVFRLDTRRKSGPRYPR